MWGGKNPNTFEISKCDSLIVQSVRAEGGEDRCVRTQNMISTCFVFCASFEDAKILQSVSAAHAGMSLPGTP